LEFWRLKVEQAIAIMALGSLYMVFADTPTFLAALLFALSRAKA
jgi:hypothetical protein